ncbi:hypothetical protein WH221_22130 [Chryseobacterium culicis]|uniref:Uncharacterized protein n=1 Tax=Chryseobacterium culicis TaxID=680127 RepID=A0A2S9CIP7_CHRCI|nr:hypothetical protein [Chryseobacterium culicis]PRB80378.1 hypothetical protein CQ022_22055 [Chryseobacterium culicis]PRB87451.1 hypothetical protein CQ033_22060 [Chryseobacterium culicis]
MNKVFKYFIIILCAIGGLFLVGFIAVTLMIGYAFGSFDKSYSVSELKEEYSLREVEIADLIKYYNTIKPENYSVDIEFKNDKVLNRLTITTKDSSKIIYQNWDVSSGVLQTKKIRDLVGWEESEVKVLKNKLDKANCISVEDGEPLKIGFKRSGMGMFSFNIFQKANTNRGEYNDGCQYILVNRYLALQYGGGAIGNQCFPDKN